jgi:hypothetical protein
MRRALIGLIVAGVVVGATIPAPATPREGVVKIRRIRFNPLGADDGSNVSLNHEVVTIANQGNTRKDLTGWTLRDSDRHVFLFPSFRLGAGERVTIHSGSGQNTARDLYWDAGHYIWDNGDDTATLRNRRGEIVHRCSYSGGGSFVAC